MCTEKVLHLKVGEIGDFSVIANTMDIKAIGSLGYMRFSNLDAGDHTSSPNFLGRSSDENEKVLEKKICLRRAFFHCGSTKNR